MGTPGGVVGGEASGDEEPGIPLVDGGDGFGEEACAILERASEATRAMEGGEQIGCEGPVAGLNIDAVEAAMCGEGGGFDQLIARGLYLGVGEEFWGGLIVTRVGLKGGIEEGTKLENEDGRWEGPFGRRVAKGGDEGLEGIEGIVVEAELRRDALGTAQSGFDPDEAEAAFGVTLIAMKGQRAGCAPGRGIVTGDGLSAEAIGGFTGAEGEGLKKGGGVVLDGQFEAQTGGLRAELVE
jgi:hypothetical protein